jgi:hypothetical protein
VTKSAQADTHRAIRDRRVFYRWLWLVYAPLVLGFLAVVVFLSGAMPGFLALPFVALLALDAIGLRLLVERRRRKVALPVPPTLLIGVGATVLAVLVGTVLAWMGVDRLSSRTGPPLLVTGGFLIVAAAFAPAFKVLDLVVRLTGRTLLRIGGEKSLRRPQPARRRSQPRPRKAA